MSDLYDGDELDEAAERVHQNLGGAPDPDPEPVPRRGPERPSPAELEEARRRLFSSRPSDPPGPSGAEIARAADRLLGDSRAAAIAREEGGEG